MIEWLKKQLEKLKQQIEKIKSSEKYRRVEEYLLKEPKKVSIKQQVLMVVLFLVSLDMMFYLSFSLKGEETELQKISKDMDELKYSEMNNSAIHEILEADKVYFIVDKEYNVNVILKEENASKVIKIYRFIVSQET